MSFGELWSNSCLSARGLSSPMALSLRVTYDLTQSLFISPACLLSILSVEPQPTCLSLDLVFFCPVTKATQSHQSLYHSFLSEMSLMSSFPFPFVLRRVQTLIISSWTVASAPQASCIAFFPLVPLCTLFDQIIPVSLGVYFGGIDFGSVAPRLVLQCSLKFRELSASFLHQYSV